MALLLVLCAVILVLSFLAASTEAALFSVTPLRIEQLLVEKRHGAAVLKRNKERIQDSIVALVILNNLANIAGSVLAGGLAAERFGSVWIGVFSAVLTFVIIMFGEVLPKTIGERHAESYALRTAGLVRALRVFLTPLVWFTRRFLAPLGGSTASTTHVTEDEITLLARLGLKHGSILESENRLIGRVFALNDIPARDIMTPRTVVYALQADRALAEVAEDLQRTAVSRIPLYGEDLDDVIGIARLRDLLSALARGEGTRLLRAFADEALYVPDTARADALLRTFLQKHEHIAIVIDEYGGTAGVVTLEDIIEQLVGEIVDEYDRDVDMRVRARQQNLRRRETAAHGHDAPAEAPASDTDA